MNDSYTKPIVWVGDKIESPPFSRSERINAGFFLRKIQEGEILEMPYSRPMPDAGSNCHELRVKGEKNTWRIIYHICEEEIVILNIFKKKTKTTPKKSINISKNRLNKFHKLKGYE